MHTATPLLLLLARRVALLSVVVFALHSSISYAATLPLSRNSQRTAAQSRWQARPFENYRITVRIETSSRTCFQEVEVHGDLHKMLRDSCRTFWISALTVQRLFDLSTRLERQPECSPSVANCPCQRLRVGQVQYDAQLGFPTRVSMQRSLRPNLSHLDYWKRLGQLRALPSCNATGSMLRLTVVSMAPLP